MATHACNPSTREVEARVQGHRLLNSEFKGSWRYMKPCLASKQEMLRDFVCLGYFFGGEGKVEEGMFVCSFVFVLFC